MTTQNIMPVYVQLILSLLDNQKFPLFKAFCLEYNQDNHINWNFEAEWQFETKDTLKQFLLNRFPNFSQELINFYHEQNIPFVLNNSKNAKALLEQNQKQLLLNVITQQKLLNQELTIFSLNHLSLDEIIQCENTGIDFYINSLYPYLHVNGDKQKFNYFIEKKKINYHISFFKDFFNLYQQYKNDNSKHYYTQKENVFKKIMQTIIDKIIEHDLFKNDFSKMSYFSSFDELENFIDDIQNADFSLYNDSLIKHIAKHNLYNPDIISKQKLVKLINNFRSYIIEPFFQEAIKDQPFEVAFDYIEYLTIQPNNTPSFYFMYNNQNVRMIKDFPLEEKEKVVKQIINNFWDKVIYNLFYNFLFFF